MSDSLLFSLCPTKLSERISKKLNIPLSPLEMMEFADGEFFCKPIVSVRNKRVFIIHSLSKPVNDNLVKLLISIDSFCRSSAKEINLIIPYFGYSRQDKKSGRRDPITAKLLASLLKTAGAHKVLLVEIHSLQIQAFFNIPADHMDSTYAICKHLTGEVYGDTTVVSPDYGGLKRARNFAKLLSLPLTVIDKRRVANHLPEVLHILGNLGKRCIMVDDMIDTGGTILESAYALKEKGVEEIVVVATHGLFNGESVNNFSEAYAEGVITTVYITDTIDNPELDKLPFIKRISISDFLSDILRVYITKQGSITQLYEQT